MNYIKLKLYIDDASYCVLLKYDDKVPFTLDPRVHTFATENYGTEQIKMLMNATKKYIFLGGRVLLKCYTHCTSLHYLLKHYSNNKYDNSYILKTYDSNFKNKACDKQIELQ